MRNKGTFYYKYYAIKFKTLEAYYRARNEQINSRNKDRFIDGVVITYKLTLERLEYNEGDLNNQEFVYNEIKNIKKLLQ